MYESEDENYLRMAQRELDLGYFESAIAFYDKAIKCSQNADNYYLKGLAYYNHCTKNYLAESETSDIKSAIQNFSTAISIAPQNAIYYYYRAKANLKFIQNYDYVEVEGDRGPTHDYKLKRDALSFILTDLQKAMNLDSAYEEEYKRFYNSNVEQKYVLEDSSIPKKYQLNLNKDSNSRLSENEIEEPFRQEKILSANSDEVKELNKYPKTGSSFHVENPSDSDNDTSFNYKTFAANLSQQSKKLFPEYIKGEDRTYIVEKIEEYSIKTGEKLVNTDEYQYTEKQKEFIIQVVAEWVFHKTIDLVHGGITKENREFIISNVAYIIFEVLKDGLSQNADRQEILNEVENQVNEMYKSCLNDLYSNSDITLETYNSAIKYSNIDDMANEENENHGSFYSTDEKANSDYLKDKTLYIYGKELAYKYLVKAAHVLKKHNCNKKDRQKILKYLYGCSEYYIDSALHVEFEFKKPEMERLLTVGMEVAFHRIVVMYKNNILNNPTMAEDIIDTFASIVCAVELNYIKDKDKLKDEYYIANTIYFRELKEHLKEWLDEGKITKEQYNLALDKSGLVYLTPEIEKLMKAKGFHIGRIGYMTIFIVVWVIFKLIIFYTKHH